MTRTWLAAGAFLAASCDDTTFPTLRPEPPPTLSSDRLLTRVSLDLRGVRPTLDELDAVERDPAALDDLIERFLADERFLRRLEDVYSEIMYTRAGDYYVYFDVYRDPSLGGWTEDELVQHIGEEPLRMLSWLAANDRPVEEWVLGDWTMADEVLASIWPLSYPAGATGWQRVEYTDERPGVGVLATNGMWWFRGSMENNRNRGRANYVSRVFLCDDYLEREVPFVSSDVLDSDGAVGDAIRTNPGCVACHESLDPLASHFYGYWWYFHDKGIPEQIERYHPERETLWRELTGTPPGYFGQPSGGLADLGRLVADDPRYGSCFVQNVWEKTTRTDLDDAHVDLGDVRDAFDASGHRIPDVFRAVVQHPAYRGADPRFELKMATPDLLSSQVEDLTGYRWDRRGRDLVTSSSGYVLLAGGADLDRVTGAAPTATVTSVLVQQRLAEAAAAHVVAHDQATTDGRLLFDAALTFTETPDGPGRERMQAQLAHLHRRILSRAVAVDGPEVDSLLSLWSDVAAATGGDPAAAWSAVVTVLLRDPDLMLY
jgi:hypothetical protein